MPTIRFHVAVPAAPDAVLHALTDFSDSRPDVWPNIDHSHFRVHSLGPGWADVTEGNVLAWERNRYDWDASAGRVVVKTLESDSWAPGSSWDYQVRPTPSGGTLVNVTVIRSGRGLRGRLIGLGMAWLGVRVLRSQLEQVLARVR
ncbi:MAG TPA: SRPBCC family protein [Candidatus Dormibacteraeota bacterium]|nr:SRPBCC family protein [Candidatus Dormibacteraeota bacterium]